MKPNERETAEGFLYTDEYQLTMARSIRSLFS
jgi:hypothetical protein